MDLVYQLADNSTTVPVIEIIGIVLFGKGLKRVGCHLKGLRVPVCLYFRTI
jgi:hypothetical protein